MTELNSFCDLEKTLGQYGAHLGNQMGEFACEALHFATLTRQEIVQKSVELVTSSDTPDSTIQHICELIDKALSPHYEEAAPSLKEDIKTAVEAAMASED